MRHRGFGQLFFYKPISEGHCVNVSTYACTTLRLFDPGERFVLVTNACTHSSRLFAIPGRDRDFLYVKCANTILIRDASLPNLTRRLGRFLNSRHAGSQFLGHL